MPNTPEPCMCGATDCRRCYPRRVFDEDDYDEQKEKEDWAHSQYEMAEDARDAAREEAACNALTA